MITYKRHRWPGNVPVQPLTLVLLMRLTAQAGVEGEAVSLCRALQPWIRPVQRAHGANHEGLAPPLRADGYPVRHGTTQKMRHGICVVCGLQVQPCTLAILLQQPLSF